MLQLYGRAVPCYAESGGPDDTPMTDAALQHIFHAKHSSQQSSLLASCLCGTVVFRILRPQPTLSTLNLPKITRWLSPAQDKYLALTCVCRYDRLSVGFSVVPFTYVPPEIIISASHELSSSSSIFPYTSHTPSPLVFNDTSTHALEAALPGLKCYRSSPDSRRSFCSVCGASVFYECESRPEVVNIAVGILRAQEGCLAESWLHWDWAKVSWAEDGVDQELVRALKEGT